MELIALISLTVFIAAVLRGLTGFGFALAAVPAMSLIIAPSRAVTLAILLQCMVGLRDTVRMRALVNRRALLLMTIGSVVGTPLGLLALTHLSPDAMRIVLAALVGVGLAALLLKVQLGEGRGTAIGAGMVAGLFSGLAAMPGPPAIAYFLGTRTPAVNTRASLMVFFFLTSLVALPGLVWAGQIDRHGIVQAAFSLPALLIGTWVGGQAFSRLDEGGYRTAAIALLGVTAALTALRGIAGLL